MNILKTLNGEELTIALEGRLDFSTAPELEAELKQSLTGIKKLVIDMSGLAYLSSAGLRVILFAQKQMNKQGSMVVKNINKPIMEVFELTGFIDFLKTE